MVTLIGAGPGASGLLTLKGAKMLEKADVVLYDRLVGHEIISMIPETAEKIDVSKAAGCHSIPQSDINALLLAKAKQGLNVVRLKGGDPFVFGRGGEELEFLADNDIEFEVVPGVSSSVAGGAYAGIPVTHRGFASSVHIITGHAKENGCRNIDYEALVKLNGTLVFMMSVAALKEICGGLISAGMDRTTPAAVIENATLCSQRKLVGSIETLNDLAEANNVASPAVIIVGSVCALSEKLDWFSRKPLFGRKVLVTRARTSESTLSERLRELGCDVLEAPCLRIAPIMPNNAELEKVIENIAEYGWLVFTSGVGVDLFFGYLSDIGFDVRRLHHLKIAAVGSETEGAIKKRGIIVDYVPGQFNGRELAKGLLPLIKENERVIIARAKNGAADILDVFAGSGVRCDDISIYEAIPECGQSDTVRKMLLNNMIDIVTFTSSSTVEGFAGAFPEIDPNSVNALCIGERTAEKAREHGFKIFISEKATISSMVEKTKEMLLFNGN